MGGAPTGYDDIHRDYHSYILFGGGFDGTNYSGTPEIYPSTPAALEPEPTGGVRLALSDIILEGDSANPYYKYYNASDGNELTPISPPSSVMSRYTNRIGNGIIYRDPGHWSEEYTRIVIGRVGAGNKPDGPGDWYSYWEVVPHTTWSAVESYSEWDAVEHSATFWFTFGDTLAGTEPGVHYKWIEIQEWVEGMEYTTDGGWPSHVVHNNVVYRCIQEHESTSLPLVFRIPTQFRPIVENSVEVYIDDEKIDSTDYVVNYRSGVIRFTNTPSPEYLPEHRITADLKVGLGEENRFYIDDPSTLSSTNNSYYELSKAKVEELIDLEDESVDDKVESFEKKARSRLSQEQARLSGFYASVGLENSTVFAIGHALLARGYTDQVSEFEANLKVQIRANMPEKVLAYLNTYIDYDKMLIQAYLNWMSVGSQHTSTLHEMRRAELDDEIKIKSGYTTWPLMVHSEAGSALGAISGAMTMPPYPDPKMQMASLGFQALGVVGSLINLAL